MSEIEKITNSYIKSESWKVLENANLHRSYTSLLYFTLKELLSPIIEKKLDEGIVRLHKNCIVHIHKLPESLMIPYCVGHSISKVFLKGLITPTIKSRPAKHLDSAIDHLVNFLYLSQQETSGAQSLSAFDTYLAPFLLENKNEKYIKQQLQRFVFNLNYPGRLGLQSPFTNITLILGQAYNDMPAILAGEVIGNLEDYVEESLTVARLLTETYLEGDGVSNPFTFPIPTIPITEKFWKIDEELLELIFKTVAYRGQFYFLNGYQLPIDDIFTMCCRLTVDQRKFARGIWSVPEATGSIGYISVNMPNVAITIRDKAKIFDYLYDLIKRMGRTLMEMRRWYEKSLEEGLLPMLKEYVGTFRTFYNTIGLIGLPEYVTLLLNDKALWQEEAESKSIRNSIITEYRILLDFLNAICKELEEEFNVPYNIELSTAESTVYRFAVHDYNSFKDAREFIPLYDNVPFYSSQITPSYSAWSLSSQLEIEGEIQPMFTGGVMKHIFLGELASSESLKKLVERICKYYGLIYFSITPTQSVCEKCKKVWIGNLSKCLQCNGPTTIWSRITGYYRPLKAWNIGRQAEFKIRQFHKEKDLK